MAVVVDHGRLSATEGEITLCSTVDDLVIHVLVLDALVVHTEWTWNWSFAGIYQRLLRRTRLAEFEDAAADRSTIEGGRVTRRALVVWRVDDDWFDGLLRGLIFFDQGVHEYLFTRKWCDRCLQTELELSLCSTDESLEDLWVVWVEGDVSAGGVREALEGDGLLGLDS